MLARHRWPTLATAIMPAQPGAGIGVFPSAAANWPFLRVSTNIAIATPLLHFARKLQMGTRSFCFAQLVSSFSRGQSPGFLFVFRLHAPEGRLCPGAACTFCIGCIMRYSNLRHEIRF